MMKKLILALTLGAAFGAVGCGNSCDELADYNTESQDMACDMQTDCMFCTCYENGQTINASGECEDIPDSDVEDTCTDSEADAAQAILDDQAMLDALRQGTIDTTNTICGS